MPNIQRIYHIEVTPEKFLAACSPEELMEVELLLSSPRYQGIMNREKNQLKLL